ncbi:MAG: cobalamin biosynthesis protein [Veillonella sp.]
MELLLRYSSLSLAVQWVQFYIELPILWTLCLGYKNQKYLYFGRVAARFDDVLNWIPARITFILINNFCILFTL